MKWWRRGYALTLHAEGAAGRFGAALPAGAAGRWCRLAVSVERTDAAWWVKVEAADAARGQVVREAFLGRQRRLSGLLWRTTLVHLPRAAGRLTIEVFTDLPNRGAAPLAILSVLGRPCAAVALLASGWPALPRALAGGRRGVTGRVRTMLGQRPARAGEAPPYRVWTALYDDWRPVRGMLIGAGSTPIDIVIIGGEPAERATTLASVDAQWVAPAHVGMATEPAGWRPGTSAWTLVMQAGERMAPQGLACFAEAVRRDPQATGFCADVDSMGATGRHTPLFKPQPDPWLLRSGLPTRGACLFPTATLQRVLREATGDAAAWRAAAALMPDAALQGLPFVLTHMPDEQHDRAVNAPVPAGELPLVSVIVPTSARHPHMLHCLRAVLAHTDYPAMEILLAVSRVDPQDGEQAANLAEAAALPGVRVLYLQMPVFNYAAVNNAAVRQARGELILLLNDDVAPIGDLWLQRMVAFVSGGFSVQADIVGARLVYGNGLVQHGGVTMGLANLCEHSFRLSAQGDAGPHGIALLNRQVSAVTAACMLVRRSLFETLGGMDEAFAVALNDVDFCLRAGQAGARIVLAAEVTLVHHESLSLGRHYEGARAHLEAVEVRLLRARWGDAIDCDPFYSPAASLEPGREFQPGFPPRTTPISWCGGALPDRLLTQA